MAILARVELQYGAGPDTEQRLKPAYVEVDNLTGGFIYFDELKKWIPPFFVGVRFIWTGSNAPKVRADLAPPGATVYPTLTGPAVVTFRDDAIQLPENPGAAYLSSLAGIPSVSVGSVAITGTATVAVPGGVGITGNVPVQNATGTQLATFNQQQALGSFATGAQITLPTGCTAIGVLIPLASPPVNLSITGVTTGGWYLLPMAAPPTGLLWVKVAVALDSKVFISFTGGGTLPVVAALDNSLVIATSQGASEAPLAADGIDTPPGGGSLADFTGNATGQGAGLRGWLSLIKLYLGQLMHPLALLWPWSPPVIQPVGGAAGAYTYVVYALNAAGQPGNGVVGTTSVGPTTLDATHYNAISWQPVPMALGGYQVYRRAGGASLGLIATVPNASSAVLDKALVGVGLEPTTAPASPMLPVLDTPLGETKATYSAAFNFAPVAAATDVITLYGSPTKLVKLVKLEVMGIRAGASQTLFTLWKRSAPNTGGTSAVAVPTPHDSKDGAATAALSVYSVNPTALGANVGAPRLWRMLIGAGAAPSDPAYKEDFGGGAKPIVLRGNQEGVALNLNGDTLTGLTVNITWTEEAAAA